jgi:hypothetical protein
MVPVCEKNLVRRELQIEIDLYSNGSVPVIRLRVFEIRISIQEDKTANNKKFTEIIFRELSVLYVGQEASTEAWKTKYWCNAIFVKKKQS